MIEELKDCIKKYLRNDLVIQFPQIENNKEIEEVLKNFYFWFEETDFLNIQPRQSNYLLSQKFSIFIVILIALIHQVMKNYNEWAVQKFFEDNLSIKEKILFNNMILLYKKPPNNYDKNFFEKRKKDWNIEKIKLIEYYHKNNERKINEILNEKIRYLFALRSQVVHKGKKVHIAKIKYGGTPFLVAVISYLDKYTPKNIKNKALYFNLKLQNALDYLLKVLFLSALIKKFIIKDSITPQVIEYEFDKIFDEFEKSKKLNYAHTARKNN